MFYVGIDIAKKNHEASIIDSNGKLIDKSISFSNSQAGSSKLISLLRNTVSVLLMLLLEWKLLVIIGLACILIF